MSLNDDPVAAMADAAEGWLRSLTPDQRADAHWPSPAHDSASDLERTTWFYTPTDHGGLPLGHQSPDQQQAAMRLLATGTTPLGYATVTTIVGLENLLDLVEGFTIQWDRVRGRDPGLYYVRVFGDPSRDRAWGWRFAGHHVSVNLLVLDGRVVSSTPFFVGADPASTPLLGGERLAPLGGVEAQARRLVQSLDEGQLAEAVLLDRAVSDIVTGNRVDLRDGDEMMHMQELWRGRFHDPALLAIVDDIDERAETGSGFDRDDHHLMAWTERPKGLSATTLSPAQQLLLDELVTTVTAGPVPVTGDRLARRASDVHFAWGGDTTPGTPTYFRLQGPGLLYEYDNTQRGANHAHSVLRDPGRDFGLDAMRTHRATTHHDGRS